MKNISVLDTPRGRKEYLRHSGYTYDTLTTIELIDPFSFITRSVSADTPPTPAGSPWVYIYLHEQRYGMIDASVMWYPKRPGYIRKKRGFVWRRRWR